MTDFLPGGAPRLTRLCDFVRYYADVAPSREAVVFGETRLDYAAFDGAIDRCARALQAAGVRPGDRIAMLTTPRPEFAVVLMATQRIGGIWVGLNTRYRLPELRHIVDDCAPTVLISVCRTPEGRLFEADLEAIAADARGLKAVVTLPESTPRVGQSFEDFLSAGDGHDLAPAAAGPDDPTVIVYTSGTTGRPKGALLAHRNLIYCYEQVSRSFAGKEQLRDGLRILCNLPPNHIGCISEMLGNAIIRGGAVVFAEQFDPAGAFDLIARERITLFGGVPVMLEAMFADPAFANADLSSVKAIGWGGAPAARDLVRRMKELGVHLFTNYGLTEGGAVVSATGPDDDIDDLAETVGHPDSSGDRRIVDDEGRDAAYGQTGEIWLKGPGVFLGYWNNPAATGVAMAPGGWLRTGDIAQARADGAWVLSGRKADMFKSGGFNVYPREIELVLEEHPDIAYAAVIAIADPRYFEVGAAFIAAKPGRSPAPTEIDAFLRGRLANYKVPKTIQVRSALPMLPIGKVDKHALRGELKTNEDGQ
ncbi:MAG TPA: AMP-binding protein [Caulobacteraceae bacterium]|nr:AMP-binding protein [Caulobacteraceae bacterium]